MLILLGGILTAASILMIVIPPKRINYLYGYRTPAAMKSDDKWQFAQKFSARAMLQSGLILMAISALGLFNVFSEVANSTLAITFFIIVLCIMFYRTEMAIKNKFPE